MNKHTARVTYDLGQHLVVVQLPPRACAPAVPWAIDRPWRRPRRKNSPTLRTHRTGR